MRALRHWVLEGKWPILWVGLLTFFIYLPTLSYDFTLDDAIVIYDNAFTKNGVQGIIDHFSHDTFRGFFKIEGKDQLVSGGRYRPLTPAIFTLLWQLFGNQPWAFHLLNVLLYVFLGFSILKVGSTILPQKAISPTAIVMAAFLFIVHPVHVEVVANVKGMDEILAFTLGLWSMYFLYKKKWWPSGLLIFLACLSKEIAVTWAGVAILVLWLFEKDTMVTMIKKILPIMLGITVYMILRFWVLGWPSTAPVMEMMNNPFVKVSDGRYIAFSTGEKWATIGTTLWEYLRLIFYPVELTHDYYPRHIRVQNWTMIKPWLGWLSTLGLAMVLLWSLLRQKQKGLGLGVGIYLGGLVLVSNVIFNIGTHMGERFIFMSSFGFALIAGHAFDLISRCRYRLKYLFLAVIFLLVWRSWDRSKVWKDDYTLFTSDVRISDNSAKALNAAGGAIIDRCMRETGTCKNEEIDLAIQYLEKATRLHPNYRNAHFIKGNGYFLKKNYLAAASAFEMSLRLDPGAKQAQKNLVMSYNAAAQKRGEQENNAEGAIILLRKALEIDTDNVETLRLLGVAHGVTGNSDSAIHYFNRILAIDPDNEAANKNLGVTYMRLGEKDQAKTYLEKAKRLENQK